MRVLLCVVLVSFIVSTASAATVRNDGGGYLISYLAKRIYYDRRGELVRISGYCASACTLFLSARKYCVTPNARLGFHSAFFPGGKPAHAATRWLFAQYPSRVRAWIAKHGGLRKGLIYLRGRELRKTVRICS
jgi:hypothetical protein